MKTRNNNGISVRLLVMILALTLIVGGIVGGSVAWLTAQTDPVTNTFTVGDINITLTETTTDFKMVPGNTIAKDPTVTVLKDSEACWLFVKVEEKNNLRTYITYTINNSIWTPLTEDINGNPISGVYYCQVPAGSSNQSFQILTGDSTYTTGCVKVNDTVTKGMMESIKKGETPNPQLVFTAYAVQKDNIATAADAWAKVTTTPTT